MADYARNTRLSAHKKAEGEMTDAARAQGPCAIEKRMCTHVAWALLVHTVLIIMLVGHRVADHAATMLGQMVVVAMIAMFVLIARDFHYRWRASPVQLSPEDERRIGRYRRDIILLWSLALGLPFVWLVFSFLFAA